MEPTRAKKQRQNKGEHKRGKRKGNKKTQQKGGGRGKFENLVVPGVCYNVKNLGSVRNAKPLM
jgi:hypothetical protein